MKCGSLIQISSFLGLVHLLCKYFSILTDSPCLYDCKILVTDGFIRNFVKCLWLIWREQTHQISLPEWMSGVFLFNVHVSRIYEDKRRVQRENKWLNLLRSWCISERCIWCHENRFHSLSKKYQEEVRLQRWFWAEAQKPDWQGSIATWKVVSRPESFCECYRKTCRTVRTLSELSPDGIRSAWVVWNFPDIFPDYFNSKTVWILPYDLLISRLSLKQISE